MLEKSIELITPQDIIQLLDNSIPEGKKIEYKESLPDGSDNSKKEFLADISSFANTEGGYMIVGIRENSGIPIEIIDLSITDMDAIILQYENLIRDSISPRIKIESKSIEIDNKKILIFKILKSWNKPHRVDFRGHGKFYARSTAGKYPLDVDELRSAFNSSYEVVEKIKNFVALRNIDILSNDTFLPLNDKGKIALFLIPLEAFNSDKKYNIFKLSTRLWPMSSSGYNNQINLEGYLSYSNNSDGINNSYVELYRNGILEIVNSSLLKYYEDHKIIPSLSYEEEIVKAVSDYINVYKELEIQPPVAIFLSFVNIKGYRFGLSNDRLNFPRYSGHQVKPKI